jgi:tetratricopeptide (TPR) repeat protein
MPNGIPRIREEAAVTASPSAAVPPRSRLIVLVGLLLAVCTLAVYYPVTDSRFVNYDDDVYVTQNPHVQAGLTSQSMHWAFTSRTASNWHPLTMLSLQLDHEFWPNSPRQRSLICHLDNLLLHIAASLVLWFALRRMTGRLWPSTWVAALFALHPLHVESVAWVAARKDVLSGLFAMLTLLAYTWYGEAPSWRRYLGVVLALTLGLLAKPMLVTLPCVLLLLDYWPLGRLAGAVAVPTVRATSLRRLVLEKIPLFALAAAVSGIAVYAQHEGHALRTLGEEPLSLRLQTAALAYVVYLWKMLWPADLAPFYPVPADGWPAWQVAGAVLFLLAVTALAWRERRRRPYLAVGWLWYLGTLVPVIGLVQVGDQAWADRYTYLPLIGIFIILAWGTADVLADRGWQNSALPVLGGAAVVLCMIVTRHQVGYWHDSGRLWEHALAVTPENDTAHHNLGTYLGNEEKKLDEAMRHFARAVELNPHNDRSQINLAKGLLAQNRRAEAEHRLQVALEVNPENDYAHVMLGNFRLTENKLDEAARYYQDALRLNPQQAEAHFALGHVYRLQGQPKKAVAEFAAVVNLNPDFAEGYYYLGSAIMRLARWDEAVANLRKAVDLNPHQNQYRLELLYATCWKALTDPQPDTQRAGGILETAREICQAAGYQDPRYLDVLAAAFAENGRFSEAESAARQALGLTSERELTRQIRERLKGYERHLSVRAQTPAEGSRTNTP